MAVTITPDQHAAVLRVAAYHRRDFDVIVVYSDPRKLSMVQPFISEPFPSPASASIGTLRRLPNEVLARICSFLDVLSCFRLRQVNRIARQVVSALPAYRDLSTYALESLRTALRTRIAGRLPVSDLHRALCTTECSQCGYFGPLLFLPAVERCCCRCLVSCPKYRVYLLSALSKASKVSSRYLRRVAPIFHSIPGKYGVFRSRYKRSLDLVAESVLPQSLASGLWTNESRHQGDSDVYRYMMTAAFPSLDKASSDVQDGVSCKGCQVALEAAIGGSTNTRTYYELRDRSYTREGFLVHFLSCEEAQKLWLASHGGAVSPAEPACIESGGFISDPEVEPYYK